MSQADQAVTGDRPGEIDARPVPHPLRWVAIAIIVLLVAMMISSFVTNAQWNWGFVGTVMNYKPVLQGLVQGTIVGTLGAMVLGVGLGIILAIMRLSENPVLRGVSFVYTWFFRAIPRLVLLVMMGSGIAVLYPKLDIGFPFAQQIFGVDNALMVGSIDVNKLSNGIIVGILGLGLSEAAYMAEIARAGIQSVDRGQTEAAQALGMSPGKTMRRVVLPQAMRVIVPPTGNETIAMVKDTSLLSAVPVTMELWYQVSTVGNQTYKIVPAYVAGFVWYLIVCSVLMVGQAWLERRFGRGFGNSNLSASQRTKFLGMIGGGGK
ncbi:amino acid ABC transporter permease [Calidifontibacter indicus]|uniref:Polar amino acid transport system permease protein n=1 Tax=Calidifontibacter indicus TaxID=419650 RepID=A0A3D9UR81_9MICO|nr:amino acid ABC transporter permease [Calidifontibacter indicus]REF31859.1 polar amino acid transport system permease protein [Calidifontibacter indicus]